METPIYNVLITEDDDLNYIFLEILIKKSGNGEYKVFRANNGLEAVEFCNANNVDIVLMDLNMPIMNGYDATSLIKLSHPELPIVAQTAYTSELERKRAFECGCDDFLTKPIQKDSLFSVMSKLINRH